MRFNLLLLVLFFSFSAKSQFNNSLIFDGINDYVNLNSVAPTLANDNSFTVEFWMRADINEQNPFPILFAINSNQNGNSSQNILSIQMSTQIGNGGNLYINWAEGTTGQFYDTQINIGDNACHHIAYVRNGTSNNSSTIYIDGVLVGSFGYNSLSPITNGSLFSIGQEFDNGTALIPSQFYKGNIDEFRIWNTPRSLSELNAFKDIELVGNELDLVTYYSFNQGQSGGNNTSEASLTDNTGSGYNGNFVGFSLNGLNSNFVEVDCCDFYGNYQAQTNQTFSLNTIVNNENCENNDGSIDVSVPVVPNNYSFQWPTLNVNSNLVQNLTAGTYNLTITDNQGCSIDTTLLITGSSATNIPAPNPLVYCQNDNATSLQLTPTSGGVIHWFADFAMMNELSGDPIPSTTNPGIFYYYFVQEIDGCISPIDSAQVTVTPTIVVNIGNDTTLCHGDFLQILINGNYSSIVWNDASNSVDYSISSSGQYWVNVTSGVCQASDTIDVNFYPEIEVSLGVDTSICIDSSINLTPEGTLGSYSWSTGETGSSIEVGAPGIYSVEVSVGGCTNSDAINIMLIPSVEAALLSDSVLCSDKTNVLSINDGEYEVTWNSSLTGNSYVVPESHPTSIVYEVTSACQSIIDTIELTYTDCECLLFVPNTFTPDGN